MHQSQIRDNHYLPEVAQVKALNRRRHTAKFNISALKITFVKSGLNEKWSPEQIAGGGKTIGHHVSHEWIHGYVKRDK